MDDVGDVWVAHWHAAAPDRVAGTRLDDRGAAQIRGSDADGTEWAAVGGRLPPRAVVAGPGRSWRLVPGRHRPRPVGGVRRAAR